MPKIQTLQNKVGNFLKFEADRQEALARTTSVVTYATAGAGDMEVGHILVKDSDKYRELVNADFPITSKEIAILLDDRIDEMIIADTAATGDTPADTALLKGGFSPCIVRKGGLSWAADITSGNYDLLVAKLATQAITVEAVFSTKY